MESVLNKRKIRRQHIVDTEDIEYWQAMAKRLDNSVIVNDITMQEIVDEVNAVRKERYEKQNHI